MKFLPSINPEVPCRHSAMTTTSGTVSSDIPAGLTLRENQYGMAVFATASFPAGSVVYTGTSPLVSNASEDLVGTQAVNGVGELAWNAGTHSVEVSPGVRAFYTWDSYMNHSCSPNTYSYTTIATETMEEYLTIAVRDIHPGDEITCDYLTFEWDCTSKTIEQCQCGASECFGRIAGFKFLSLQQQLHKLEEVDARVLARWVEEYAETHTYIACGTQPSLGVVLDHYSDPSVWRLLARKDFSKGEVVFQNKLEVVDWSKTVLCGAKIEFDMLEEFGLDPELVATVKTSRKMRHVRELNSSDHSITRRTGGTYHVGFDTFMNHSCSPCTVMEVTHGEQLYSEVATTDIPMFTELTCDYSLLDDVTDYEFDCRCGAQGCRGKVGSPSATRKTMKL